MPQSENFPVDLDELDFAILSQLQQDGRKSFSDIAKELDTAVNTIRYRVSKLVASGTLHFYAFVNPLDLNFNALSEIQVKVSPSRLIEDVALTISEMAETSFVVMVTGEFDLLVEANCQDSKHLLDLLNRLHQIEGVLDTKTCTYLKVFKWHQPNLGKIREQRMETLTKDIADNGQSSPNIRSR